MGNASAIYIAQFEGLVIISMTRCPLGTRFNNCFRGLIPYRRHIVAVVEMDCGEMPQIRPIPYPSVIDIVKPRDPQQTPHSTFGE